MKLEGSSYELPGTVSAVFFTKADAEKAYSGLLRLGHSEDDVSLLVSDETLNSHTNPHSRDEYVPADPANEDIEEQPQGGARHFISNAILSITSMISLPELGISISKHLMGGVTNAPEGKSIGSIIATKIPEAHCEIYENGVREGGIIISVDPKNRAERDAIIREFRTSNGHDILGDDGYTELD